MYLNSLRAEPFRFSKRIGPYGSYVSLFLKDTRDAAKPLEMRASLALYTRFAREIRRVNRNVCYDLRAAYY